MLCKGGKGGRESSSLEGDVDGLPWAAPGGACFSLSLLKSDSIDEICL